MFSEEQKNFIDNRGSKIDAVMGQLANFKAGFPYLELVRPATIDDGIIRLSDEQVDQYVQAYKALTDHQDLLKFVPASGAATRMFKDLFEFLNSNELNSGTEQFIKGVQSFAFYDELTAALKDHGHSIEALLADKNYEPIVRTLLTAEGLNYGSLPKGLLAFHKATDGSRTSLEEHLVEGAKYAMGHDGMVNLHFTVSPEHQDKFEEQLAATQQKYEEIYGVKYQVSFSQQKKSTDTIAVDLSNAPIEEEGKLLFRPAGHGALLENLNDLDADVIFVKNIDNVVPDRLKEDTITYKKALAALLISFQKDSFAWQHKIEVGENCLDEAVSELERKYGMKPKIHRLEDLSQFLNRPVRVCGMVENTGEPGGGPFWVKEANVVSLQIAETAQIYLKNQEQEAILKKSSHFNPVDLVCGVRNFKGETFDLIKYRNDKTGFITQKSKNGKELKAMELPGLWNGAMADWITLFVEVPVSTFNPVKTVNDLLKPNHQ